MNAERTSSRLAAAATILAVFVCLFWRVLFQSHDFAFRDTPQFYAPLYQYVHNEWTAGRFPLWNPLANSGEPLLANSTSGVFYPAQLVFWLPLSFRAAFTVFILGHVLLAAAVAFLMARRWGTSAEGAALAAQSYAFSGSILFQYCNLAFLVSAAWLPLALCVGDGMLRDRRGRSCCLFGLLLALMVLAGDPQLAYEARLLVGFYAWLIAREERGANRSTKPALASLPWRERRPVLLVAAAGLTASLAAVQLFPTMELNRLSDRAYFDVPRSLFEIPAYAIRDYPPPPSRDGRPARWYQGLIGDPPALGIHEASQYEFSVPPWRWLECLWPNASGTRMPVERRWLGHLLNEGSFWTPSLYMGLLPFSLALAGWRLRGADVRTRWLSWLVLFGVLGALGSYGAGWLGRWLAGTDARFDHVGGLYWLFTVALPGFAQFRYPAKLLTISAIGLSGLAALSWDRFITSRAAALPRLLLMIAMASLAGLVALAVATHYWDRAVAGKFDPLFGPLDARGAYWGAARALAHGLICSAVFWGCLRWVPTRWLGPAVLTLTALDLALAQQALIVTAPATDLAVPSKTGALLRQTSRVFAPRLALPPRWATSSSPTRPQEVLQWRRDLLRPNYSLIERVSLTRAPGTIDLYDYNLFLLTTSSLTGTAQVQPRRALDALGTGYFLVPKHAGSRDLNQTTEGLRTGWLEPRWSPQRLQITPTGPLLKPAAADSAATLHDSELEVVVNPAAFPRAWIVRDLTVTPPIASTDQQRLFPLMMSLVAPVDRWIDMRRQAWVEDDSLLKLAPGGGLRLDEGDPAREHCRVEVDEPQRVEIDVLLTSPGLVVLADQFYPGWELHVETDTQTQPAAIFRTNRVMRGALLPPGRHRLIYEYQPWTFYSGLTISSVAWGVLLISLAWQSRNAVFRRRPGSALPKRLPPGCA